jgi:tRNA pseudouridine32 synthase/23S rRNA pseudouridine746 synthase
LVPLHRIDRDTAGLVMFSVNPASRGAYQALFREHRADKRYLARAALARRAPDQPPDRHVDAAEEGGCLVSEEQARQGIERRSRIVRDAPFFRSAEAPGEPNAHSHIQLLEVLAQFGLFALRPVTGRTHQLRVHMAALGWPICGDRLYPNLRERSAGDFSEPLQLLAHSLRYIDPLDGQERHWVSARSLAIDEPNRVTASE